MEGPWSRVRRQKREPASDINTAAVVHLKVRYPEWPIREADMSGGRSVPHNIAPAPSYGKVVILSLLEISLQNPDRGIAR